MTLGEDQEAFTLDVARLIFFAAQKRGLRGRMREVERRPEMQKLYVEMGASQTMYSQHGQSLAIDIYFTRNGKIVYDEEVGRYWESLSPQNSAGMFWKSFKDAPHFERRRTR